VRLRRFTGGLLDSSPTRGAPADAAVLSAVPHCGTLKLWPNFGWRGSSIAPWSGERRSHGDMVRRLFRRQRSALGARFRKCRLSPPPIDLSYSARGRRSAQTSGGAQDDGSPATQRRLLHAASADHHEASEVVTDVISDVVGLFGPNFDLTLEDYSLNLSSFSRQPIPCRRGKPRLHARSSPATAPLD
jgi:hypothetical protein